jgi:hypothetical protein
VNEHEERLKAMVDPDQQTWDLSPDDVKAIRWALDQLASMRQVIQEQKYQRNEKAEEADDLRILREATLMRWERSLQEIIDVAERAKRKVSHELATGTGITLDY